MQQYSNFDPLFRKELLSSLISLELNDIKYFLHKRKDINGNTSSPLKKFRNKIIVLEFSDGFSVDISVCLGRFIEINETLISKHKFKLQPDINKGYRGGTYFNVRNKKLVSIKELRNNRLKSILNLKIKDTFLLKMPLEYVRKIVPYGVTMMGVNGIGIGFENGQLLLIYIGYKKEQFDGIYLSIGTELIDKGYFNKSKEFFEHGKLYNFALAKNFCLDQPVNIDDLLIRRSDIQPNTLIDIYHPLASMVSEERLVNIIESTRNIDLKKQILFFESLREILVKNQFGLVDLKFGLDEMYNFKIVKPIDYVAFYQENITFIDSVINVLRNSLLVHQAS